MQVKSMTKYNFTFIKLKIKTEVPSTEEDGEALRTSYFYH